MHLIKASSLLIFLVLYPAVMSTAGGQGSEIHKEKGQTNQKSPTLSIKVVLIDTMDKGVGLDRAAKSFDMFVEQLKLVEHLKVKTPKEVALGQDGIPSEVQESLAKAQSLIHKGKECLLNISLDSAAEAFQSARVTYRKNLAWLDDPEPLIGALMGLAEALSTMGNEEGTKFSYKEVLGLNPDFEPDPGQVPSKLRSVFEEVRQEVSQQLGGQLSVEIKPEGARVIFDGLTIGQSPVFKGDVPAGLHMLKAIKKGFMPFRKVVEVQGGQTTKIEDKLKPLLGLEIIRRLRIALAEGSDSKSLELARDLGRIGDYKAVICSQLAKPAGNISPVFSTVIIPPSGKPSKLAASLPDKNAKRVLEALALQISDTLDEGSSPVPISNNLGLNFSESLLGTPKALLAPTVHSIPPGLDINPTKEPYPGPATKKPGSGNSKNDQSIWTRWWLWTGVGIALAGGIATTLVLTMGENQKIINDPDRILIMLDTSPER